MIDFELTEEQKLLKTAARDFLTAKCPDSLVRAMRKDEFGYPKPLWQEIAGMGWAGLLVPKEYGGEGGDFLDFGILIEEMGRVCLPGPFFASAVCSALIISKGGSEQQKQELLPKIAGGESITVLALTEGNAEVVPSSIKTKAARSGSAYAIKGVKFPVSFANTADYILCAARTGRSANDISLFLVNSNEPGVKCSPTDVVSGDKQFKIEFNGVKVSGDNLVGELNQGWEIVQKVYPQIVIAKCLEMVGGAQKVLEMTLAYCSARKQFGHLIGSYQSIQHHCANMVLAIDGAKFLTYQAAWMLSKGLPCATEVAMAKSRISKVYREVTFLSHQIHGAVAFCDDHALPLYIRRSIEAEEMFGSVDSQLETVARGIGL
ncbi:MAG: acyl-CoA dehydrogenase family protein [Chloroflexota bacterium]